MPLKTVPLFRLFQIVDHFHQRFPVVEGFRSGQQHMGFNARIDAVKGTVGKGCNLQRAGHLEDHAGSRRGGENHVGTAAGALTDQGDPAGVLKDGGHQIAAGEG